MTSRDGDLDTAATLAALQEAVVDRRRAEVHDLELVLHWCAMHTAEPHDRTPGGERLDDFGGDGTPWVKELAVVELGVARQVHPLAARAMVADSLDLRYRLPETLDKVRSLEAEVWLARKIARMTRELSYDQVGIVDAAVAAAIGGQSPARVITICEAKIIEADQAAHEARLEAEAKRRYVGRSRIDRNGLQHMIARLGAGDLDDVDALIDQVADVLAEHPDNQAKSRDELRADAFGWLGRPEDLLALLNDEPAPRQRRHRGMVFVHLSDAAVESGAGVARVEGLGPHLLSQLRRLLGHRDLKVLPVVDLNDRVSVNAYEHSERIADRIHLAQPGDAFPHACRISRRCDLDHPDPYDRDGPEGQTNSHDSQPLSRTPHRAKTHLAYRCTRLPTGEVLWRTPHGLHRVVDHLGTRVIDDYEASIWLSDDPINRKLAVNWHRMKTGRDPLPV